MARKTCTSGYRGLLGAVLLDEMGNFLVVTRDVKPPTGREREDCWECGISTTGITGENPEDYHFREYEIDGDLIGEGGKWEVVGYLGLEDHPEWPKDPFGRTSEEEMNRRIEAIGQAVVAYKRERER